MQDIILNPRGNNSFTQDMMIFPPGEKSFFRPGIPVVGVAKYFFSGNKGVDEGAEAFHRLGDVGVVVVEENRERIMLPVALDEACIAARAAHAPAFESCFAFEGGIFQEIANGTLHACAGQGLAEARALGRLRRHVREEVGDEAGGCPVRRREAAAVVEVQSRDVESFRLPKGFEDADATAE